MREMNLKERYKQFYCSLMLSLNCYNKFKNINKWIAELREWKRYSFFREQLFIKFTLISLKVINFHWLLNYELKIKLNGRNSLTEIGYATNYIIDV